MTARNACGFDLVSARLKFKGGADMGWQEVDEGWGARAKDWAYLFETRWWPEPDEVLREAGVGEGTRFLDVCCGSGLAAQIAARRGAVVHGLDASDRLLTIASARTPDGDFRHGDMHALPWDDESFDVVTSFRGIWGPNDQAIVEAERVLRPGGVFAVTFFPSNDPVPWDLWWSSIARVSDHENTVSATLGSIAEAGRAEQMCEAAHLVPGERRSIRFEVEVPEVEDFVRGSLAAGPTWTAIKERGQQDVEGALRRDFTPMWDETVGLRIGAVVEYLVATKPG